ncbi:MAG: SAM-dependent methyltransferase [Polyangiales bacterium]
MSSAPDPSKYTTVGHRDLDILNPVSSPKLDAAIEALELSRSSRALDLGCGKGALVARIERKFSCESIGVDRSPALVDAARNPNVKVGDAKEFLAHGGLWDAIACVGSSHIFGDAASTLAAIVPHLAPNGRVLLGEGYWRREPAPEYLASFGGTRDELLPLGGLVALGARHDLVPTHVAAASEDDFDRYEWSHARAIERFARENPLDPDAYTFLARSRTWRTSYLQWGRETLGFALIVWTRG